MEISAAAPPPTPLKMATSWGIAVILTNRATGTAMTAPSTMATSASTRFVPECRNDGRVKVITDGEPAAAAPTRLPSAGVLGRAQALEGEDEAGDGDQVGQIAGRQGEGDGQHQAAPPGVTGTGVLGLGRLRRGSLPVAGLGLEHLEHAVGHHEAADDVERGQEHGEEAEHDLGRAVGLPHDGQAPTSTMPWMALQPDISGVCRMLGTLRDDLDPDERGQDEDGQVLDDARGRSAVLGRRGRLQVRRDHDCAPPVAGAPPDEPSSSTAAGALRPPRRGARTCRSRSRRPKSGASSPVRDHRGPSKLAMLRA